MRSFLRDNIFAVQELEISADELVRSLLGLSATANVCILDSCGVGHLNSHLLIAGIVPVEVVELSNDDPEDTLRDIERILSSDKAAIFSLSYDFGRKLQGIKTRHVGSIEPDAFIATFDHVVVHDYDTAKTVVAGDPRQFEKALEKIRSHRFYPADSLPTPSSSSNFTREQYLTAIETIKESIRDGSTYQTNLTRQVRVQFPDSLKPEEILWRLRRDHPAPFSAFLKRQNSTVISASPERFFEISNNRITASPIKGTRPRGDTSDADEELRNELLVSEKDRAENTMIVDLLRNDLGRVCQFGSVQVEKLCEVKEHPTLFHLVSTISGKLRNEVGVADALKAIFPCGSITGAPKISTMRIIDEIEIAPRGISMGAIGYRLPASFGLGESIDLSVAIRTMVVEDQIATFNVGGGIVIDSDPQKEWEETIVKSRALMNALGIKF